MPNRNKKEGRGMYKKKGQSILEYVIVLTVIIAAIAFAAKSFIGPAVQKAFQDSNASIQTATGRLPGANQTATNQTPSP